MNTTALRELREEILKIIEGKEKDVADFTKVIEDSNQHHTFDANDNMTRAYCQSVINSHLGDIGINKRILRLIDALYYEDERKDFQ